MKSANLALFLFFLCISNLEAANPLTNKIDNAFEALHNFNYFDARNYFLSAEKKFPCISNFGLALIYYRSDNPFHNIDSAYTSINKSVNLYNNSSKKEKKKSQQLNLDLDSITATRIMIVASAFISARAVSSVSALNHFILTYTQAPQLNDAIHVRDSLAFNVAKKDNNSESYQNFMSLYPDAYLFNEAKVRFEKALYDESVFDGKESSYARFIDAYPASPHITDAMQKIYEMATFNSSDPEIYKAYILKYPSSKKVDDAWQRIYDLNIVSYDAQSIRSFKNKYPDYPFMEKLDEDIRLAIVTLLAFKKDNLTGLMNTEGKVVVDAKYDLIGKFHEGISIVSLAGKMGFITKSGEEIIPPFFDDAENFHEGLAIVSDGNNYGVINRSGKMVVPLTYAEIGDFSEGLAAAFDGKLYGFISGSGKIVIPFIYKSAGEFKNGYAICSDNVNFGLVDKSGKETIPFKYSSLEWLTNDILKFSMNEKIGLLKKDGTLVLPDAFDEIGLFTDRRAVIVRDGNMGYIDTTGSIIIQVMYKAGRNAIITSAFHDGYAAVKKQKKALVIDVDGKTVIDSRYDEIKLLTDSIFAFKKTGRWGIGVLHGNSTSVSPTYEVIQNCEKGNCIALQKGKYGLIDLRGKIIVSFQYESLVFLAPGLLAAKKNEKLGVITLSGDEIIPFVFNEYNEKEQGFVEFSNASKKIWLDLERWRIITMK